MLVVVIGVAVKLRRLKRRKQDGGTEIKMWAKPNLWQALSSLLPN